jgi:hypothetical protein
MPNFSEGPEAIPSLERRLSGLFQPIQLHRPAPAMRRRLSSQPAAREFASAWRRRPAARLCGASTFYTAPTRCLRDSFWKVVLIACGDAFEDKGSRVRPLFRLAPLPSVFPFTKSRNKTSTNPRDSESRKDDHYQTRSKRTSFIEPMQCNTVTVMPQWDSLLAFI